MGSISALTNYQYSDAGNIVRSKINQSPLKIVALVSLNLICVVGLAQQDSTAGPQKPNAVFEKLKRMDFSKYVDKPVGCFFRDLDYPYKRYTTVDKKPGFIYFVMFSYGDSIRVDLAVKDLGQKEPLNYNYKFDINVFVTKKINWICLKYAGTCVKGCEHEECY
jgi:hypothetical protein